MRLTSCLNIFVINLVGKATQESSKISCDCKDAIYGSIIAIFVIFNLLQLFYINYSRRKKAGRYKC